MAYEATKKYSTESGLSCCFRQWRATHSHCSKMHGYAIGVKIVFRCTELDDKQWVLDFGGLKKFKAWLQDRFDHRTLVATDDPLISTFRELDAAGLIDLIEVDSTGCESFARHCYDALVEMLKEMQKREVNINKTATVYSVEVFEHGANSAIYYG